MTLPGAVLPGPFPIAARKTYGHVSDGMIASARELGLGDEHNGILRARPTSASTRPSAPTRSRCSVSTTSRSRSTSRPTAATRFSLRGVAREYSHATGAAFRDPGRARLRRAAARHRSASRPSSTTPRRSAAASVRASSSTRVVRGVDPSRPTPPWMIARLIARRHALARRADRHHQLRDARARPADPRVRPRQAHRRHHRAPRARRARR